MIKSVWRLFTAIFLITLFLGSKGIELHGLTHLQDGDQASCEWCDHALLIQVTPFEPAPEYTLDLVPPTLLQNHIVTACVTEPVERLAWESLLGRAPPAI